MSTRSKLCARCAPRPLVLALGLLVVTSGVSRAAEPLADRGNGIPATATKQETPSPMSPFESERATLQHKRFTELGVDRWQAAGFRGQGIKIAIIDMGFRGYRRFLGKALPANLTIRSFRKDGNVEAKDSMHGILCCEEIHALAPDAELLFADWDTERPDEFLAAVHWAREQGARVISTSVVSPSWSDGEGGGLIHQELARLFGTGTHLGDLLAFSCAGNTVERHWGGPFQNGGDGFHEWKPGVKDNGISPWGNERVSVELYSLPGSDYELTVYDAVTNKEIGRAKTIHNPGDRSSAVVRFDPEGSHDYKARVKLVNGPGGVFHLCVMESSLEHRVARGSVCFPADGSEFVAVGATDSAGERVWYSACGPNSRNPKPELMAPIPFPTRIRERQFAGTSAAAPEAAALAAVVWSHHPDWTPEHVRNVLRSTARDLGQPGFDYETGFGLIHLPQP